MAYGRNSIAMMIATCWIAGVVQSAAGQPYLSSRYAEPSSRSWAGNGQTEGLTNTPQSATVGFVQRSAYSDYRLLESGHTSFDQHQFDQSGFCDAQDFGGSSGTQPDAVFADPGSQGDVWSDPIPVQPRLRFRPGVIVLQRGDFSSQPFTDGATPTNATDFNPSPQAGYQGSLLVGSVFSSGWDLGMASIQRHSLPSRRNC